MLCQPLPQCIAARVVLAPPRLFALELMKFGVLTEQPFEAVADRPFPQALSYPVQHQNDEERSVFLLSRVLSLVPMPLAPQMWDAHVDFDLAAFASLVRILIVRCAR